MTNNTDILIAPSVQGAISLIPRRFFVGEEHPSHKDTQIPIGQGVNSTKPSQVANMLTLLDVKGRVLEVGTGCGWQTALLTHLADDLYSIEVNERLHERAAHNLKSYPATLKHGNGYEGWPEHAPFDRIIVCAAMDKNLTDTLINQLQVGGIMVVPVGDAKHQKILRITREEFDIDIEEFEDCGFVVAQ